MADLRLVDESLEDDDGAPSSGKKKPSPYVLALYDAFSNPKTGLINLVIEYMDGGSLADLVKCGGCSDEDVLSDIAGQVLDGLNYLHENNQMHRDIKPGNILLNCRGDVKIADFGISKAMDGTAVKFANSFVGTVTYMSPERIIGEAYGFPGDIWSFGVTMFTVADGYFPFSSDDQSYWGMISAVCDKPVPVPAEDIYSDTFRAFIASCLEKSPITRGTAKELMKNPFIKPRVATLPYNHGVELTDLAPSGAPPGTMRGALASPGSLGSPGSMLNGKSESTLSKITHDRIGGSALRLTASFAVMSPAGALVGSASRGSSFNQVDRDASSSDITATPVHPQSDGFAFDPILDDIDPTRLEHLDRILESLHDIVISALHASELMNLTQDAENEKEVSHRIMSCMSEDNSVVFTNRENSITRNSVNRRMMKPMDLDTVTTLHNAARKMRSDSEEGVIVASHVRASGLNSSQVSPSPSKHQIGLPSTDVSPVVSTKVTGSGSGSFDFTSGTKGKGKKLMKQFLSVAGFVKPDHLLQWKHLANQLYLPYKLVVQLAREKLEDALWELDNAEH